MDKFYDLIVSDEVAAEMEHSAELFPEAEEITRQVLNGENVSLEPGMLPLLVCRNLARFRFEQDAALGIDEKITVATLKDVNIWQSRYFERTKKIGTDDFNWLLYSYLGKLYRIGRLQYEPSFGRPWMNEQCNVLRVHIPEGEPLNNDDCIKSMREAVSFFDKFFPELKPTYFTCESWLLCPFFEQLLGENSNTVKFMKMWTKVRDLNDSSAQAIQRTFGFGFKREHLKNAPENTSLQRKMKEFLLNGNQFNEFAGYIKIR